MRGKGVPFTRGDKRCGRPKGRRNKLPSGSIKGIFHYLAETSPELYEEAIKRALRAREAKSVPMVALAAAYVDGRPVERLQVDGTARMLFVPGGVRPELGE